MRKNILFNTTRQWNPGDQFIMLGIMRILKHLDFNPIIYNRHPSVWGTGKDNSFKPGKHTLENIDYYIHAGTPEWTDQKLKPLFDEILERDIPHSFIGVGGSGQEALKTFDSLKALLKTSELVTARDQSAFETLKQLGGIKLPCPGFLCGNLPEKPKTKLDFVGLVFMTCETNPNSISPRLHLDLIEGYKEVIKKHNAIIICHYIDEAIEARTHFPDTPIFYSYDAKDFADFYSRCDLVISPRLHGCLLAAGLGIPSVIITGYREQDLKRRIEGISTIGLNHTSSPFIAYISELQKTNTIRKESKRLTDLRYKTEIEYLGLVAQQMVSLVDARTAMGKIGLTIKGLVNKKRELNGTL